MNAGRAEAYRRTALLLGERGMEPRHRMEKRARTLAGSVTAILGHVGVVDRDGDIIDPGSMRAAPHVVLSAWNHSGIRPDEGEPPVGRAGRVWEEAGKLMATAVFDDSPRGRATCEKISREKPDWSFGLRMIVTRPLTDAEKARGARRAIKSFELFEISPVSKGASVAQGTLAACCGSCALATAGKAHAPCDSPPAPDEIVPSQRDLARRLQATTQRMQVTELVGRIRDSLARIEGAS